jgi:hypothetical protein
MIYPARVLKGVPAIDAKQQLERLFSAAPHGG